MPSPFLSTILLHDVIFPCCARTGLITLIGWFAATISGSSLEAGTDPPTILITEVMYNPASNERGGRSEWVELANVSSAPITMDGWRLEDEDRTSWGIFDCHLPSGEVVVLVNAAHVDADSFHAAWSSSAEAPSYQVVPVKWGALANQPSPTDEHLRLVDASGATVCAVNLGGDDDWPRVTGAGGQSVWLSSPDATTLNSGKVWLVSEAGKSGAVQSRSSGVFEGVDIGSPGAVPWLAAYAGGPDAASPIPASDRGSSVEGDRLLDYEMVPRRSLDASPVADQSPLCPDG